MVTRLTFEIRFTSDFHVSAGHGWGSTADSALLRDADGVPVIRGTTVTGLLRDGLWRLLQLPPLQAQGYQSCRASGLPPQMGLEYCGQWGVEAAPCPACRLFGSPAHPKQWRISSARPANLAELLPPKASWARERIGGQVSQRVRVSPATRRAETAKLFSEEHGDARLCLRFTATRDLCDTSVLDEAALLVAAARNMRELGRSRRRGQGTCTIHLIAPDALPDLQPEEGQDLEAALLQRFEERWLRSAAAVESRAGALAYDAEKAAVEADGPVRVRLVLRTDEPVLVARRAEAGSQFEGLSFITGQAVRGMLADMAARRLGLQDAGWRNNPAYEDFVSVFFGAKASFPVLYPAYNVGAHLRPAIPAPQNLLACKTFPALTKSRRQHSHVLVQDGASGRRCSVCDDALRPVGGYLFYDQGWETFEVDNRSELHIRMDPERGRVSTGALFGYVAVEAGQTFVGDLVCRDAHTWAKLLALTGLDRMDLDEKGIPKGITEVRIGRASRRGYGKATLRIDRPTDDGGSTWVGLPLDQRLPADPGQGLLVLTLLTDAILPDRWGREWLGFEKEGGAVETPAAAWLSEALGAPVQVLAVFGTARPVDGFSAQLGLPRWRDVALAAGSTVVFSWPDAPEDWQGGLRDLEEKGIGIRRNEGFGRVVVNHPVQTWSAMPIKVTPIVCSEAPGLHELQAEAAFRDKWRAAIRLQGRRIDQACSNQRFAALARWLHDHAEDPLDDLIGQLEAEPHAELGAFGQPQPPLVKAIGPDEYGERSKENYFYNQDKGAPGRALVADLLRGLKGYNAQYSAIGVLMLADRIAAAAREEE